MTEDHGLAEQRRSLHLLLRWDAESLLPYEEPPDVLVRLLEHGSEPALGALFWGAFRGTVDEPGTAQSALTDAVDAFERTLGSGSPGSEHGGLGRDSHSFRGRRGAR